MPTAEACFGLCLRGDAGPDGMAFAFRGAAGGNFHAPLTPLASQFAAGGWRSNSGVPDLELKTIIRNTFLQRDEEGLGTDAVQKKERSTVLGTVQELRFGTAIVRRQLFRKRPAQI